MRPAAAHAMKTAATIGADVALRSFALIDRIGLSSCRTEKAIVNRARRKPHRRRLADLGFGGANSLVMPIAETVR